MTVAVVGSRTFADRARIFADLDALALEISPFTLISGGAGGADQLAEEWARLRCCPFRVYRADWQTYGRTAGPRRNAEMIPHADLVIAYWDGVSRGSRHAIGIAHQHRIPVQVHYFGTE